MRGILAPPPERQDRQNGHAHPVRQAHARPIRQARGRQIRRAHKTQTGHNARWLIARHLRLCP
ncbi:hypothetical protein GCM10009733_068960 [Nonomuraea maheshkhaliensis]|uniref:Transposase n=1 Tax=Nonomuraea maheshkhaliensis TaxID=419590 RepID=A0ABP4RV85_9ACTN